MLNPIPVKHKRFHQDIVDGLTGLVDATPEDIIGYQAQMSGPSGVTFAELLLMTNLPEKALSTSIGGLLNNQTLVLVDKETRTTIHHSVFDQLKTLSTDVLSQYHAANPLKPGISKEELKSKFPRKASGKLFTQVLNRMIKDQLVTLEDDTVRLTTHTVSLQVDQKALKQQILDRISGKSADTRPISERWLKIWMWMPRQPRKSWHYWSAKRR